MTSRWAENLVSPALLLATQIYSPESPTPTPPNTKEPPTAHTPLLGVRGVDPLYHLQRRREYKAHLKVAPIKWLLYLARRWEAKFVGVISLEGLYRNEFTLLKGKNVKVCLKRIYIEEGKVMSEFPFFVFVLLLLFGQGTGAWTQTVIN